MAEPSSQPITECTAQLRGGAFCGSPSMEGAPFPLCASHVRKAYEFGAHIIGRRLWIGPDEPRDELEVRAALVRTFAYDTMDKKARPAVYYLRVGELIKIGYTERMARRMRQYPPDSKLLAVEYAPNAWLLERQRHQEFRAYLKHGQDWFDPAPELLTFIESIGIAA